MPVVKVFNSSITINTRLLVFHYRTVIYGVSLLRPYGFLLCIQLCCCLLFIVHEYWRNSTSYIASCHPLTVSLRRVLVSQTIPNATGCTVCYLYFLYPSETGRWFHFAISCPSIKCILTSYPKPIIQICCLYPNLVYLVYLLLRNGWHSISLSYV